MSNGFGPLMTTDANGALINISTVIDHCSHPNGKQYTTEYGLASVWTSFENFIEIREYDGDERTVMTIPSAAAVGVAARILRAAFHYHLPAAVENTRGEAVCQHPDYEAAMRFCDAIIGDDREVVIYGESSAEDIDDAIDPFGRTP